MRKVGLTGGIGSGKSTVTALLAARGAVIIDADKNARAVVARGTPGLRQVVEAFGPDVLRPDGELDREAVGRIVFADPAQLARLNAIVHPLIAELTAQQTADAVAAGAEVVVYDVPLLVEARADDPWELIVVAHAPAEVRSERLVELRGMTEADAAARIASQVSDDARLAIADAVIDTAGTLDDTLRQVDRLWETLPQRLRDGGLSDRSGRR